MTSATKFQIPIVAIAHHSPWRLLTLSDVEGDLHTFGEAVASALTPGKLDKLRIERLGKGVHCMPCKVYMVSQNPDQRDIYMFLLDWTAYFWMGCAILTILKQQMKQNCPVPSPQFRG